ATNASTPSTVTSAVSPLRMSSPKCVTPLSSPIMPESDDQVVIFFRRPLISAGVSPRTGGERSGGVGRELVASEIRRRCPAHLACRLELGDGRDRCGIGEQHVVAVVAGAAGGVDHP